MFVNYVLLFSGIKYLQTRTSIDEFYYCLLTFTMSTVPDIYFYIPKQFTTHFLNAFVSCDSVKCISMYELIRRLLSFWFSSFITV